MLVPPPHYVFVMFMRLSVHLFVGTLLTRYLRSARRIFTKLTALMHFGDRDESFTIWGQKVRVEDYAGIKLARYGSGLQCRLTVLGVLCVQSFKVCC